MGNSRVEHASAAPTTTRTVIAAWLAILAVSAPAMMIASSVTPALAQTTASNSTVKVSSAFTKTGYNNCSTTILPSTSTFVTNGVKNLTFTKLSFDAKTFVNGLPTFTLTNVVEKLNPKIADGTLTQLKYTGASQAGNVSLTSDGTVRNNAKGALYPAGELTFSNYTSAVIVPTPPTTTSVINGNAFPDLVVPYYSNLSLSASSDAASLYFKYIFTSASLPKLSISILQDMSMSFFSTSAQTYCVYNMPFKTNTTMAANLQGFNNFVGSGFASNFSLSRLTAFTSSSLTFSNTFNLAIPQTQLSIDNIGDVTLFVNVTDTTISSTPFLLGTMQIPNLQLNSTSGSFATAMSLQVNFPTNPDGSLITTAPLFKLFQNQFQSADRRTARGEAPQEVIKVSVFGTTASTSIPVLQDAFASLNISTTVTIPAVPSTVSFSPQSIGLPKLVSYTPNTLVFSTTVTFIHPDAFTLINIGNVNFTATLSDDNSTLGTFTVNSFSLTAGDKPYPVAMTVTFSLSNGNVNTSTTLYNKFLRAFDSTQPTITPPNVRWEGVAAPPALSSFFYYNKPLTFDPVPTVAVELAPITLSALTSFNATALTFVGGVKLTSSANIINLKTAVFGLVATSPSSIVAGATGTVDVTKNMTIPNLDFSTALSQQYTFTYTVVVGAPTTTLYKLFRSEFSASAIVNHTAAVRFAVAGPIDAPAVFSFLNFTSTITFGNTPAPSTKTLSTLGYSALTGVAPSTLTFTPSLTLANSDSGSALAVASAFSLDFAISVPTLSSSKVSFATGVNAPAVTFGATPGVYNLTLSVLFAQTNVASTPLYQLFENQFFNQTVDPKFPQTLDISVTSTTSTIPTLEDLFNFTTSARFDLAPLVSTPTIVFDTPDGITYTPIITVQSSQKSIQYSVNNTSTFVFNSASSVAGNFTAVLTAAQSLAIPAQSSATFNSLSFTPTDLTKVLTAYDTATKSWPSTASGFVQSIPTVAIAGTGTNPQPFSITPQSVKFFTPATASANGTHLDTLITSLTIGGISFDGSSLTLSNVVAKISKSAIRSDLSQFKFTAAKLSGTITGGDGGVISTFTSASAASLPAGTSTVKGSDTTLPDLVVSAYTVPLSSAGVKAYYKSLFTSTSLPSFSINVTQNVDLSATTTQAVTFSLNSMSFAGSSSAVASTLVGFGGFPGSGFTGNVKAADIAALKVPASFTLKVPTNAVSITNAGDLTFTVSVTDATVAGSPFTLGSFTLPGVKLAPGSQAFSVSIALADSSTKSPLQDLLVKILASSTSTSVGVNVLGSSSTNASFADAIGAFNVSSTLTFTALPSNPVGGTVAAPLATSSVAQTQSSSLTFNTPLSLNGILPSFLPKASFTFKVTINPGAADELVLDPAAALSGVSLNSSASYTLPVKVSFPTDTSNAIDATSPLYQFFSNVFLSGAPVTKVVSITSVTSSIVGLESAFHINSSLTFNWSPLVSADLSLTSTDGVNFVPALTIKNVSPLNLTVAFHQGSLVKFFLASKNSATPDLQFSAPDFSGSATSGANVTVVSGAADTSQLTKDLTVYNTATSSYASAQAGKVTFFPVLFVGGDGGLPIAAVNSPLSIDTTIKAVGPPPPTPPSSVSASASASASATASPTTSPAGSSLKKRTWIFA